MKEWKWKNNFKCKLISSTDFPSIGFSSKEALRRVTLCGNSRGISLVHTTVQRQFVHEQSFPPHPWNICLPGNRTLVPKRLGIEKTQFEKTFWERNVIIFIAVIVVGYWTGSFPVISSIPTLLLKFFSTGPMHVKNFLVWEKKRKRGKWVSWRCIYKESFSFRPFAVNFYF